MKLLAAGDIHGDSILAEKLAIKAKDNEVDLAVLCGDIAGPGEVTDNILGHFVKRNIKTIIIPGNHESFATADFLAEVYNVTNLHGYTIKSNGIGLFGCGGANIGLEALPEEEIFSTLKTGHEKIKNLEKKIMITHVHPAESKMDSFSNFVPGSTGIKKAIDELKPDFLLCSHVHEAEGVEEYIGNTKIINVGRKGKILDLKEK